MNNRRSNIAGAQPLDFLMQTLLGTKDKKEEEDEEEEGEGEEGEGDEEEDSDRGGRRDEAPSTRLVNQESTSSLDLQHTTMCYTSWCMEHWKENHI